MWLLNVIKQNEFNVLWKKDRLALFIETGIELALFPNGDDVMDAGGIEIRFPQEMKRERWD